VEAAKRAFGAAGEADEAVGVLLKFIQRDLRQVGRAVDGPVDVEMRVEPHQVHVALFVLGQQDDGRGGTGLLALLRGVVRDRDLAADDGLNPCPHRGDGELQRREHVVGVGHGDGGHRGRLAEIDKLLHRHRAFQQRVFGVGTEVDESGRRAGHGGRLARSVRTRKGR